MGGTGGEGCKMADCDAFGGFGRCAATSSRPFSRWRREADCCAAGCPPFRAVRADSRSAEDLRQGRQEENCVEHSLIWGDRGATRMTFELSSKRSYLLLGVLGVLAISSV